jgi:ribosome modulation factor
MTLAEVWRFGLTRRRWSLGYWHGYEHALNGRPRESAGRAYHHGYTAGADARRRDELALSELNGIDRQTWIQ